jgi:hypothetical protein
MKERRRSALIGLLGGALLGALVGMGAMPLPARGAEPQLLRGESPVVIVAGVAMICGGSLPCTNRVTWPRVWPQACVSNCSWSDRRR